MEWTDLALVLVNNVALLQQEGIVGQSLDAHGGDTLLSKENFYLSEMASHW